MNVKDTILYVAAGRGNAHVKTKGRLRSGDGVRRPVRIVQPERRLI